MRRLPQRDELAGERLLERVEEPPDPLGDEERERLDVLLAARGVDRLRAMRADQRHAALGGEPDDALVQRDHARLHARPRRELVGKAREARVEQAVEALLEQVEDVAGGVGEALEPDHDVDRVEGPGRVEAGFLAAVGVEVERRVRRAAQPHVEEPVERGERPQRGAVHLRHDARRHRRLRPVAPDVRVGEQRREPHLHEERERVSGQHPDARRQRPARRSV